VKSPTREWKFLSVMKSKRGKSAGVVVEIVFGMLETQTQRQRGHKAMTKTKDFARERGGPVRQKRLMAQGGSAKERENR